jgi:SNF2 family DNA or RNA helicase
MPILHGSWIFTSVDVYFFVWSETWRTIEEKNVAAEINELVSHPFNLSSKELLSFLLENNLLPKDQIYPQKSNQIIALPSQKQDRSKKLLPIFSSQLDSLTIAKTTPILKNWQIEGLELKPQSAIKMLSKLPLSSLESQESYLGADLRFWSHIYRWCLDLLTRRKFLPGISFNAEKKARGCWYPLLDSTIDQTRFAKFTQMMPAVCRTYVNLEENEPEIIPQFTETYILLLNSLRVIVDTLLQNWSNTGAKFPHELLIKPWLQALSQTEEYLNLENKIIKRLETACYNWTLPIQEYLVTPDNQQLGQNQFRVCFKLEPPHQNPDNSSAVDWQLSYWLQALDDPKFSIDAQTIWNHSQETLIYQQRTLKSPQETLLKGLGLASHIYEPIANSLETSQPVACVLDPLDVYQFIRTIVWQLQDNGLGVILPLGLASGSNEKRLGIKIEAEVTPEKGERLGLKTLLNYNIKLAIGDKSISQQEFNQLLEQKSPLVEIDGEWMALQPADLRATQVILDQSTEAVNLSVEDALRLSMGDSKTIAKLPVVGFEASGILQEFINNLTNNQSIKPIKHPQGFKGELRPYQARGVGWLAFLEQWGLGACLADDMGLGKTPQLIAFLLNLKAQDLLVNPVLVVCPTSVLSNWEREVRKFAPTLSTFVYHGDKRPKGKPFLSAVKNRQLVITSYPLVYRDQKTLEQVEWQVVVLDEAQNIKNSQAKQSQAVRKLKAGFRIALTGTPVENRLSELWSILDFLNPGFLGNQPFFQRRFAIPIEKYGDRESLGTLRLLVRPFILRRLKTDKDIIQDLPEKQEMNIFCGLSKEQAQLYQNLVDQSLAEIEEATGIQRRGLILTLLLKLKQLCNHPAQLLKENSLKPAERSGKLLRLEEMLEELVDEGDRALIFTQFAQWGKLLQPYLNKKLGREVIFLYGGTRSNQRQEMIDRFQNDPNGPPIFILSLKAGGTGLNLTRANHVFHIDRWWNPAVENQATDRAFRIGQKRNVQVHKFICTGTLEEKINDMIESKKQLAEQTVDAGENWLTELDTDQLRTLLLLDRDAVIDE